jgi:hypothetical protein
VKLSCPWLLFIFIDFFLQCVWCRISVSVLWVVVLRDVVAKYIYIFLVFLLTATKV